MPSCLQTFPDWTQTKLFSLVNTSPLSYYIIKLTFQSDSENPNNAISKVCFGENISLADCVDPRSDCMSCAVKSLSTLSAKRSANHAQRPKSSSWNSPHPFYYSACIREVFTLQRPAKKLWAELRVNRDTTVYRSTIQLLSSHILQHIESVWN